MHRAKTRQQIADEFGIDRKTLYRWLKRNKISVETGLLTPFEQAQIYHSFGKPERPESQDKDADKKLR
jgi:DNA invertase Pin-like site-specific DNA recombinase